MSSPMRMFTKRAHYRCSATHAVWRQVSVAWFLECFGGWNQVASRLLAGRLLTCKSA